MKSGELSFQSGFCGCGRSKLHAGQRVTKRLMKPRRLQVSHIPCLRCRNYALTCELLIAILSRIPTGIYFIDNMVARFALTRPHWNLSDGLLRQCQCEKPEQCPTLNPILCHNSHTMKASYWLSKTFHSGLIVVVRSTNPTGFRLSLTFFGPKPRVANTIPLATYSCHPNMRILHSSSGAQDGRNPETVVCRIPTLMWSFGPLS